MSAASAAAHRARHIETIRAADRVRGKRRWLENRDQMNAYRRKCLRALRLETIAAYGGQCVCCGEKHWQFLCIDHVNNDGAEERRATGKRSIDFYRTLRAKGFPKDRYQLLCHNCNQAKAWYGRCPHQDQCG